MEQTIYFRLFDGFFYKTAADGVWVNVNEVLPGVSGKKACLFLKYLIINRKRVLSSNELIETFWPESVSSDPENALQQMLFKVRSLLKKMAPGIGNPIISRSKQCSWNPELVLRLDLEAFEELFAAAKENSARETELLLEAIELYGSGIQAASEAEWLEAARSYYHEIYLDMCRMVLHLLQEQGRWNRIIELCEQIREQEPYADEFPVQMMQAYILLGDRQAAAACYLSFRDRLQRECGMAPSPEAERLYALAIGSETAQATGQSLQQIIDRTETEGALCCPFNVFVHLVMIERRNTARSGQPSSLVVFSVNELQTGSAADVHRVERVLRAGLRGGDAVTRLNAASFLVLLSGASNESAERIARRIRSRFTAEFRQSDADISFQCVELPEL